MVKILLMNNLKRISVFYQNDSYGEAGLQGVKIALQKRGMKITSKASYERNTLDVENAVSEIAISNPDAVIMIGAYKPCAMFIQLTRDGTRSRPIFLNVSFVGSDALAETLSNKGLGVVITQVVPYPFDKRMLVVAQYHQMTQKYMKDSKISIRLGLHCGKSVFKDNQAAGQSISIAAQIAALAADNQILISEIAKKTLNPELHPTTSHSSAQLHGCDDEFKLFMVDLAAPTEEPTPIDRPRPKVDN